MAPTPPTLVAPRPSRGAPRSPARTPNIAPTLVAPPPSQAQPWPRLGGEPRRRRRRDLPRAPAAGNRRPAGRAGYGGGGPPTKNAVGTIPASLTCSRHRAGPAGASENQTTVLPATRLEPPPTGIPTLTPVPTPSRPPQVPPPSAGRLRFGPVGQRRARAAGCAAVPIAPPSSTPSGVARPPPTCPSCSAASRRRCGGSRTTTTGATPCAGRCPWTQRPTCWCSAWASGPSGKWPTG